MKTTEAFRGLECTDCGTVHDASVAGACPDCGGATDPVYDYGSVDVEDLTEPSSAAGIWGFDALLPFDGAEAISAREGDTPLVAADRLADELEVDSVFIKDEARNPTGTVLDRGFAVAVSGTVARAQGVGDDAGRASDDEGDVDGDEVDIEPLACASPGNAGQSMAAYAGHADLRSYAFVPSRCAFSNKAMTNVHGGEMQVVGGRFPDAAAAVDERLSTAYTDLGAFATPYRHEGAKTLAFEVAAELGWDAPDAVVIPTSTGEVVVGVAKGFRELEELGILEETPKLVAAQPTGCAPIAGALEADLVSPEPVDHPDTICGELEIPEPAGGERAIDAVRDSSGTGVTVDDDDVLESAVAVAQNEVLEMGAAGGAAPAGAWALAQNDWFDEDDTVVLVNTEAGLKTPDVLRSHLMGKGI
ncbi:MAG: pyridoxal-phosphate dependent enzyme [Halopenitus sp.]